jgi:hypothetical protein
MGVYFPNMKKPPTCSECPVKLDCGLYLDVPDGGINSNCPVIYVNSSHGNLGDLDALINNIGYVPYKGSVRRVLMSAPIIIPSEGGSGGS